MPWPSLLLVRTSTHDSASSVQLKIPRRDLRDAGFQRAEKNKTKLLVIKKLLGGCVKRNLLLSG